MHVSYSSMGFWWRMEFNGNAVEVDNHPEVVFKDNSEQNVRQEGGFWTLSL